MVFIKCYPLCFIYDKHSETPERSYHNIDSLDFLRAANAVGKLEVDQSSVMFEFKFDTFTNLIRFTRENFNFGVEEYSKSIKKSADYSIAPVPLPETVKESLLDRFDLVDAEISLEVLNSNFFYININNIKI